jgi:Spy/CpxP family protein refolding chaperone
MKNLCLLTLAVLLAPGVGAQQRDSVQQPGDTAEAARLRARIDSVFGVRVQRELNLTPEQTAKLRTTQEKFSARRRTIMTQQMERRRALDGQMRPGIAAKPDSVNRLLAGLRTGRADMFKLEQDQDEEMSSYLSPVQRAQYQQMREHFMQRVSEMRMQRRVDRGAYGLQRGPRAGGGGGGRRRGI